MKNHGHWRKYIPESWPEFAPDNAIFWRCGDDDWYVWSRAKWKVFEGKDASKTRKVAVLGDRVISTETDVTLLSLPTEFTLYELKDDDATPKPGWLLKDNEFVEP